MSARPALPSPTAAAPAAALHSRVLDWYAEAARDLPWRGHTSPWGVFVSEIMLQQTPVARVEPVWREWLSRWPSPPTWLRPRRGTRFARGAGSATPAGRCACTPRPPRCATSTTGPCLHRGRAADPARGGGVHRRCSRRLRVRGADHGGRHQRAPRAGPLGAGPPARCPSLTRSELALAESLVPADPLTAATWNVAVMELGALVCTARGPRCEACPLAALCAWQQAGRPAYEGRRAAVSPGTAPTGKPGAPCSRCCASAPHRSPGQSSRQPSPTRASGSAASTPLSLTGWWSRSHAGASGLPGTP